MLLGGRFTNPGNPCQTCDSKIAAPCSRQQPSPFSLHASGISSCSHIDYGRQQLGAILWDSQFLPMLLKAGHVYLYLSRKKWK